VTTASRTSPAPDTAARSPLYNALIGLASLGVLLQALWAGIFMGGAGHTWVEVHQHGAEVTTVLALVATIVAIVQLRPLRDVWIGSIVLTVLLVVETFVGTAIDGARGLTALHVPLAMLIFGLAVWLPLRTRAAASRAAVTR
jgi:hypothetical protein